LKNEGKAMKIADGGKAMRRAEYVYATVNEIEGEFDFDGMASDEIQKRIKKTKWLKWERRLSDKGKEKWFLVADFTDQTDTDKYGLNRNQRLANWFLDEGMILLYRNSREDKFDINYEQYVWGTSLSSKEKVEWREEERKTAPAKVYVDLHPTYTYSNVIIGEGYIDELKEYVNLVDWLTWDWYSIKGKPVICVSGGFSDDAVEKHLERTYVFLQRILSSGEHSIFIRDSRSDDWTVYESKQEYTEQQMQNIEIQKVNDLDRELNIQADIEQFTDLLAYKQDERIKKRLDNSMEELRKFKEEEIRRQERLKRIWNARFHREVCSKLQEAERESELTDKRYSSKEVLEAMKAAIGSEQGEDDI
jgi:hypothetical protein